MNPGMREGAHLTDENWKLVARIADTADKLYKETMRLRRDVRTLWGRIEPFEGLPEIPEPVLDDFRHRNLKEALDTLAAAAKSVRDAEYDLSTIRSRMDEIAADAISREDMKPYIIDRPRRRDGP